MEDERLVTSFLDDNDLTAFSLLVERYQQKVFRLVCSVLGPFSAAEAEDVTQEIFLKVFQKMKTYKGGASFRTWLYRLAYNTALDWRRKRKESRVFQGTLNSRAPEDTEISHHLDESDPMEGYLTEERKLLVTEAIEQLPELYRTMIYMYYWLETPVEEMAEELGLPEGTVKSYLFRAREYLRQILEKKLSFSLTKVLNLGGSKP